MGESVVKSAALWLGKLLVEEINYLGEVTSKVETLQSELNTLAAFLMEAVKTRRQDTLVQTALTEGRNVAYDCQDVIETYILQVARHGYEEYEGCQLGSALRWACLLRKAAPVHTISSQIDDLTHKISALKNNLVSYGVSARINQVDQVGPEVGSLRRVYTHEREEFVVVGLEKDLEVLVERLLDPTDQTVITICGMGGLGKSTLARELYHHPKLREGGYFQAFGWAPASQRLQPDRVLRTILYSLVPENDRERRGRIDENLRADRAHAALYELMRQVKCLVLVDDIWTTEDWGKLQAAFPRKNATGSRVVLTTRNQDVLSSALDEDQVHLHPMEGLDESNSWQLFQKTAFSAATCTDSTKEKLGREMLRHCKGVPLAIVVLGEVLKRKERVQDWKQIHNDIFAQIRSGASSNNPIEKVYNVLQVSYDELPYHLKHCFLHLANFPEDYEMPIAKVCQLWVAEGIVLQESGNECEEDIAERYLNELVSRNMVQVASWIKGSNRMETCRLHDLMRDVCIDIAKREGFLQTINCKRFEMLTNADHLLMNSLPQRDKRLRRLAVYINDHHSSQVDAAAAAATLSSAKVSRAPNLRSLLLFSIDEPGVSEDCKNKKAMKTIFEDYPLLRVFDCEEFDITQGNLPKKVGNLVHLRYLCLAKSRVIELPSSIVNLQWLQTLDLRVDSDIVLILPNILWKMKQLRHLYLPNYGGTPLYPKKPGKINKYLVKGGGELRLDGLSKLQTIEFLDLDRLNLNGLFHLERLKTLRAECETNRTTLYPLLRRRSGMKSFTLKLHAQIINEDPMILSTCEALYNLHLYAKPYANFQLSQQIRLEMLPQSLVYLGIWYLQLADDPMPVLELLPSLLSLSLHMCYGGLNMVCSAKGFPKLTDLVLDGLFSFSHWELEQGALQKLENMWMHNCPVSAKLPDAFPSSVNVHF